MVFDDEAALRVRAKAEGWGPLVYDRGNAGQDIYEVYRETAEWSLILCMAALVGLFPIYLFISNTNMQWHKGGEHVVETNPIMKEWWRFNWVLVVLCASISV